MPKPDIFRPTNREAREASDRREKTQPLRALGRAIFGRNTQSNSPQEKDLRKEYKKTNNTARLALGELMREVERPNRTRVRELQNILKGGDIKNDKEKIAAYQELISIVDPARFEREIKKVDGVMGSDTLAAYEHDKTVAQKSGDKLLQEIFGIGKPSPVKPPKKPDNGNKFTKELAGGRVGGGDITSYPYARSSNGTTLCSMTARLNLEDKLGLNVPSGDADSVYRQYLGGGGGDGMLGFDSGRFSPPQGADKADIMLDTPQLPGYSRDYGHRAAAYKENGVWYVLDPYMSGAGTQPVPLGSYLDKFENRPGYGIRGAAYYT